MQTVTNASDADDDFAFINHRRHGNANARAAGDFARGIRIVFAQRILALGFNTCVHHVNIPQFGTRLGVQRD